MWCLNKLWKLYTIYNPKLYFNKAVTEKLTKMYYYSIYRLLYYHVRILLNWFYFI